MLLEDKNAVIYGGGGSIGGAVATACAREGAGPPRGPHGAGKRRSAHGPASAASAARVSAGTSVALPVARST